MDILNLIERLKGTPNPAERFHAFRCVLDPPGDVHLFYAFGADVRPSPGSLERAKIRVLYESTVEEWWGEYNGDSALRGKDPVRSVLQRSIAPIKWSSLRRSRSHIENERLLWRHPESFGILDGVAVPLHDSIGHQYGSLSFLCFGGRRDFDEWFTQNVALLAAAGYYFHHGLDKPEAGQSTELLRLSRRERQCLGLVAKGFTSKQIARRLDLSPRTIDLHIARAIRRVGASNRIEAVSLAMRSDWLE